MRNVDDERRILTLLVTTKNCVFLDDDLDTLLPFVCWRDIVEKAGLWILISGNPFWEIMSIFWEKKDFSRLSGWMILEWFEKDHINLSKS